jgi:hypothetical protein
MSVCVRAHVCVCGLCLSLSSDGIMLIVKSQAEADAATRSDMGFLEWVIVILNGVIFTIPILYSFLEYVSSELVQKLSVRRKYSAKDRAQDPKTLYTKALDETRKEQESLQVSYTFSPL